MQIIEVTTLYCPNSGGLPGEDNTTHHLAPTGPADARYMKCRYCGRTEEDLRAEAAKIANA